MTHPGAMPLGFTYEGEPLYPAAPVPVGEPQPLALTSAGEAVWAVAPGLVGPGQPQPFGVLASGAYVWALEQPQPVQRPARRRLLVPALAGLAVLAAGTGVVLAASGDEPVADRAPAQAADPVPAAPAEEPAGGPVTPVDFTMPDLRGQDLQSAQDEVQELGVLLSRSHDLRGTRAQVVDSGWRVCAQTPAAGTRVRGSATDWEGRIDFGVVRLAEACP